MRVNQGSLLVSLLSITVSGACAGQMDAPPPPESPEEAAALAVSGALDTTLLMQDIGDFVGGGFGEGLARSGPGGLPVFSAPLGCSAQISLDATHIELAHDCTLPSGRHVAGSLRVAIGGDCGFGGLTVDFDLLVESSPGAGDEVAARGHVALKHGFGELWLATALEHVSHLGRDVEARVGGCFMLDLPERRLALDGVVSLDVDGARLALFRIGDLQHMLCEPMPYTGTLHVEHRGKIVQVIFDRDTPKTGVVTVVVDGRMLRVTLPLPTGGWCTGGQTPAPVAIDYASCGGCGNPVPPPADPTDPNDPIPEPPAIP